MEELVNGTNDAIEPTVDERLANVERILSQFDKEAPPLPEADVLRQLIQNLRGEVDSVRRCLQSYDGFADAVGRMAARIAALEKGAPAAVAPAPHDAEHEARTVVRVFECGTCAAQTQDTVKTSESHATEKPCAVCGRIAKVIRTHESEEDKQLTDSIYAPLYIVQ